MKTMILCVLGVMLLPAVILPAQEVRTPDGVKAVCETFLEYIQEGDYNRAFSYLQSKPTSIPKNEFSQIEVSTIQQANTIRDLYGEVITIRLISEENVAGTAMKLVYLVVRENLPIRWKFIYYKPEREWKLVSIEFDDLLEELF